MSDPAIECAALRERVKAIECEKGVLHAQMRLSVFAHGHSLVELLQRTLDELEALTGSRIGFFHFVDDDQRTLRLQSWSTNTLQQMCTAEGAGQHYDLDKAGVWVDCVRERRPVIHNDYATLPHRKGLPPGHAPVDRELCVPVFDSGRIAAVLGVGNKPVDYDARDVDIVTTLARLAWDIAGRKRAEEDLARSRDALRNLAAQLQAVREEERAVLSRELHDELGQMLTALSLNVAWLEKHLRRDQPEQARKVSDMQALVRETLQVVRRISAELRPALMDDVGLFAAIEAEAARFTGRTGVRCALDVEQRPIIEKPAMTPVFRIMQEALTNVVRHAAATRVEISWLLGGDRAVLTVRDDGRGISTAALDDLRSLGIVGMRERALALGGELTITGKPGAGTAVTLSVPLSTEARRT